MANKSVDETLRINKKVFMHYLKISHISIRKLGKQISRTEKIIRMYLNRGEMPIVMFFEIADYSGWGIHEILNIVSDCSFIRKKKYAEWMIFLVKREENILMPDLNPAPV